MTRPFSEDLHAVEYPLKAKSREDEMRYSPAGFSEKAKDRGAAWFLAAYISVLCSPLLVAYLLMFPFNPISQAARRPPQKYKVSLIQPDGKTYATHEVTAPSLVVFGTRDGQTVNQPCLGGKYRQVLYDAPIGWLWKIERVAEKEDK